MDTNNEILDAIEILADKKIGENITKILTGICKSVNINNNTCVMDSNGVISTVQFYGSPPEVNELYRIFVPSNNMSRSFIVVPPKFTVNPNLLDNWYFGRPVNQRNGYIIPRDTQIYADSTLTDTSPGVTTAWRQVEYVNSTFCIYRGTDGTGLYYVKTADAVRGYTENTGVMYTIDRWKTENNIVVTLESDGLSIENIGVIAGQFNQELPPNFVPEGSLVCISAMVKSVSGDARLLFSQNSSPYGHTVDFIPLQTGLFSGSGNLMDGNHKFVIYLGAGSKIKLIAAKLELGSTQTLAHLENGNWVLNEIPKYEDVLSNCQRYAFNVVNSDNNWEILGSGFAMNENQLFCFIPTSTTLRGKPSIAYSGSFRAVRNTSAGAGIVINAMVVDHASNNGVSVVCTSATSFEVGEFYTLWCVPGEGTNSLIFSADL